jgi:C2 domain
MFSLNFILIRLKTILPGTSQLEIRVWDHDFLVKDDLIGQTTIDLENRFFSKKWRKLEYPPIETRNLKSPLSSVNRGRIKLWVEIFSVRDLESLKNIWEIAPKPPSVNRIIIYF